MAKDSGEIRQEVDVNEAASMFWQVFFGTSFEQSFFPKDWTPGNCRKACTSCIRY